MTTWMKRSALGLALAGSLGLAAPSANAGAMATAILDLQNLLFIDPGTGLPLANGTNVTVIGFSQNANATATLNGTTVGVSVPSGIGIDIAPQCLGAGCGDPRLASNTFGSAGVYSTVAGDPSPPGSPVSQSDQLESGSPVSGVSDGMGGFLATPARVAASSTTSLFGNSSGDADANNGITAQFTFILTSDGTVRIEFDATAYLETFVQFLPITLGESAQASYDVSFSVDNLTTGMNVFSWTPDGAGGGITGGTELLDPFDLNDTISNTDILGGNFFRPGGIFNVKGSTATGSFAALTPVLAVGDSYQLTARMGTRVDVASVPEPGTLGLLGLALVGIGYFGRRRMSS